MTASPSSTPPTSTATAAARRSSAGSSPSAPTPDSRSPPRWAAAPIPTCPRRSRSTPSGPGPTAAVATSASTASTSSSCTARRHRSSPTTASIDALDTLVDEGAIAAYGVSVETCDEALTAIARPNVATVQIILNAFRRKPLEQVLPAAAAAGVGIIARVPLASGLLSGKYDESTTFAPGDHRTYNRGGEAFDVGETFAGVPFEVGVRAARRVTAARPAAPCRPGGAALDPRPARRQHRHPRRPQRGTGARQRRRGDPRPARRRRPRRAAGHLRRGDPRARPHPLVTGSGRHRALKRSMSDRASSSQAAHPRRCVVIASSRCCGSWTDASA